MAYDDPYAGMDIPLPPDPFEWSNLPQPSPGSWRRVDLTAVLNGTYEPLQPTVGARDDGVGLFYPGRIHTVSSESEGGKTWLALAACKHELEKGEAVLYLDFEDDEGVVVGRLLALGTDPGCIRERFVYLRPEVSIHEDGAREHLTRLIRGWKPTLAVIDGVTEAMTLHGLEMKDNTDVARFGKLLPRFIADQGAAVVALDHLVKSTENRGRYAIGGVHKLNAVNGAAYLLENRQPFGIGVTGRSTVRIAKDRPGQLRRHGVPSSGGLHWFGDLVITSVSERVAQVEIVRPVERTESPQPTHIMRAVVAAIEEQGPLSGRQLEALVRGRAATIRQAVTLLGTEGVLSTTTPFHVLKPYPGGDES
jgi:hypothetical protein